MVNVIRPSFVVHSDDKSRPTSIFSCDVSPDGKRLATASLDQKVKIWNTDPILDEVRESDPDCKKLLSTLSSHNGVVLCVRWNPDGRFLASGADDYIVIVWERDEFAVGRKVFGQTEENHEVWTPVRRLVGHENDVGALAWSQDGYYMASGSVDGNVIVWDAETFQQVKRLTWHTGMVKGVSFDPVGEYLATQADDRSVCIWRTTDWSLVKRITEPFVASPNASFFRRLSWSPEGAFLAVPNSVNNRVFVATILKRRDWGTGTSLIGHDNVCDATAFNPVSFVKDVNKPAAGANMCAIVAVAARSTISIWLTTQVRPVVVFDTIVDRDVLDLSWSRDGTTLYACSSDGHVSVVHFRLRELGNPAPAGARESFLGTWQFNRAPKQAAGPAESRTGTAGAPNMLVARKGGSARAGLSRESSALLPIPPPGAPQQITMVNGKRRIKPAFLGLGSIVPQQKLPAAVEPPQHSANVLPVQDSQAPRRYQDYYAPEQVQQYPGQPSASGSGGMFRPPPVDRPDVHMLDARLPQGHRHRSSLQDIGMPSWAAPQERPVLGAQQAMRKRRATEMDYSDENEPLPSLATSRPASRTLGGDRNLDPYNGEVVEIRPPYIPAKTKTHVDREEMRLAVPAIKAHYRMKWDHDGVDAEELEYRNYANPTRAPEIALILKGKVQWLDYLPAVVIAAAFTPTFAAVACDDRRLNVYSPNGRRMMPSLQLDAPCAHLDGAGSFLLAITALGTLAVWDVTQRKATFRPASMLPLLAPMSATTNHPPLTVISAKVRPNGCPIVSLSSGLVLSYDNDLQSWTELSSSWWAKGSDLWESAGRARTSTVNAGRGAVKLLEAEANDWLVAQTGAFPAAAGEVNGQHTAAASIEGEEQAKLGNDDDWRTALTLGHLEARMQAAIALDSLAEYRIFLNQYAKKLAEEAFRGKAEELIKDLMGPVYFKTNREDVWSPMLMGVHKHTLLKDALAAWKGTRSFGKLASDTNDLLKKIQAD